jgi:hypothetical protein
LNGTSGHHPLYPGETASARSLLTLAHEYRRAAIALAALGRARKPLTRAPYRFAAIHSIELYLSAYLLHLGRTPADVRGMHHHLDERLDLAVAGGLVLRKRTALHLRQMAAAREYQASRYDPELATTLSDLTRLAATLEEIAAKTQALLLAAPQVNYANPAQTAAAPGALKAVSAANR